MKEPEGQEKLEKFQTKGLSEAGEYKTGWISEMDGARKMLKRTQPVAVVQSV